MRAWSGFLERLLQREGEDGRCIVEIGVCSPAFEVGKYQVEFVTFFVQCLAKYACDRAREA